MNIKEHRIEVIKTGIFCSLGDGLKNVKYLWICAHGYGQTARALAEKFDWIDDSHYVVSLEGLSKFYWEGVTGRPVANWMTKKNRFDEIKDFSNFFQKVFDSHAAQINADCKIILFGFSQGATTIWRWIHQNKVRFDWFINWAGWIPEDIKFDPEYTAYLNEKRMSYLRGDKDMYYTEKRVEMFNKVVGSHQFEMDMKIFDGEHKVYPEILKDCFQEKYVMH